MEWNSAVNEYISFAVRSFIEIQHFEYLPRVFDRLFTIRKLLQKNLMKRFSNLQEDDLDERRSIYETIRSYS